jgi:DNA helicase-2/ATP-dependent DNA helicase PcrA
MATPPSGPVTPMGLTGAMAIRCGHCGADHDTVAEVRACAAGGHVARPDADGAPPPPDEPSWEPDPATGQDNSRDGGRPRTPRRSGAPARSPAATSAPPVAVEAPALPTTAADVDRLAGPEALGRWALVAPGATAPPPWAQVERVVVDAAAVADPAPLLATLVPAWHERRRLVVELHPDAADALDAAPGWVEPAVVWTLPARFAVPQEALHHLVRSNAVDLRQPDRPRWPLADQAVAAGATPATAAGPVLADPVLADVVLADGTPAWLDGGPLARFPAEQVGGAAVVPRVAVERGSLTPLGLAPPTAELAPDQLAAVAHPGATARIIAPAGSGKTRVLTERTRHLLGDWRLPASSLCLVAYNKRAADEIRSRTPDLAGLQVRTLNALGLAILQGSGPYRRRADVRVIDERDVRNHLSALVTLPRRVNTDPLQPWLDALSAVRLGLRDPAEVELAFGGDVDGLAEVLPRYRAALAERGQVDFDEQIVGAIEVLLTDPDARQAARRSCRVLLVDELQDLTPAHLLLVRLLASPDLAVFGVGDDDQTIYGYAGATPEWLIGYAELFPGAGDHPLEVNYRCPPAVVGAASNLLTRNRRRVPKVVRPAPGRATAPDDLRVARVAQPAAAAVERVAQLLAAGAEPGDIAVLARVNASLAAPQILLQEAGVPVRGGVGPRWLDRTGVRAALAWARVATDPDHLRGPDLREVARRPSRGCSNTLLEWVTEKRTTDELRSLADRLNKERDAERVRALAADIDRVARQARRGTAGLLRYLRRDIGLDEALGSLDAGARSAASSSHLDDLDTLEALAAQHTDPSSFEPWLAERLAVRDDPGGVQLSSVHAVKGREWPHVLVHAADRGLFPHRLSDDVEEERRVFHVAITRGITSVTVLATDEQPSPFLDELAAPGEPPPEAPPTRRASPLAVPADRAGAGRGRRALDVEAVVGLDVAQGGQTGRVVEVDDDGVVVQVGRAQQRLAFGTEVTIDRKPRRLVAPSGPPGLSAAVEEALRAWRRTRSQRDGVPAYVVFADATLVEIARSRPTTLVALGRISGIGPAKLDRYGDEITGVVADAVAAT